MKRKKDDYEFMVEPVQHVDWLDRIREIYRQEEKRLEKEQRQLPDGRIRLWRGTFCRVIKVQRKEKRISLAKDPDMMKKLARREYIRLALEKLRYDQTILGDLKGFPSVEMIVPELQGAYRKLPKDYFFMKPGQTKMATQRMTERHNALFRKGYTWEQILWAEAEYPRNPYRTGERMHVTSFGLDVRSKAECLIAEQLYDEILLFRLEELLEMKGGRRFYPDFTILRPDGAVIYWEHAGMTYHKEYLQRHKQKMEEYEHAGIVPWENLIVSYDHVNGAYDAKKIHALIHGWLT